MSHDNEEKNVEFANWNTVSVWSGDSFAAYKHPHMRLNEFDEDDGLQNGLIYCLLFLTLEL